MNDFAYVAILVAFFALAGLLVRACERVIGPDEQVAATGAEEETPTREVAA